MHRKHHQAAQQDVMIGQCKWMQQVFMPVKNGDHIILGPHANDDAGADYDLGDNLYEAFGWHVFTAGCCFMEAINHYDYGNYCLLGRPEDVAQACIRSDNRETWRFTILDVYDTHLGVYSDTFTFSSRQCTFDGLTGDAS